MLRSSISTSGGLFGVASFSVDTEVEPAAIFVVLGLLIRAAGTDITTFTIRLDDKCGDSATCSFPLFVKSKIKGPIYVYLHFKDFYVQHRAGLKSVSHSQLAGEDLSLSDAQSDCPGAVLNKDIIKSTSVSGKTLDPEAVASPCGLYASLFPKDDFSLKKKVTNASGQIEIDIPITTSGIAWENQKDKFVLQKDGNTSWIDTRNGRTSLISERFIEWMRTPLRSTFYKLWGKIHQDLESGLYQIYINNGKCCSNEDISLSALPIEKSIVLQNVGWIPTANNPWVYYSYFMAATLCIFSAGTLLYVRKLEEAEKS